LVAPRHAHLPPTRRSWRTTASTIGVPRNTKVAAAQPHPGSRIETAVGSGEAWTSTARPPLFCAAPKPVLPPLDRPLANSDSVEIFGKGGWAAAGIRAQRTHSTGSTSRLPRNMAANPIQAYLSVQCVPGRHTKTTPCLASSRAQQHIKIVIEQPVTLLPSDERQRSGLRNCLEYFFFPHGAAVRGLPLYGAPGHREKFLSPPPHPRISKTPSGFGAQMHEFFIHARRLQQTGTSGRPLGPVPAPSWSATRG